MIRRRKPMRRKKKRPNLKKVRKTLERKLDAAASRYVRKLHARCLVCGKTENLHAHHWFKARRYKSTRWNPANLAVLCAKDHTFGVHQTWSGHEHAKFHKLMESLVGFKAIVDMEEAAKNPGDFAVSDLQEMLAELERLEAGLQQG